MKKGYLALALLIVFVVLASSYENLTALDEFAHATLFGSEFLKVFSWFGNTTTVIGMSVILLIWQLVVRNGRGAVLVLASVAGATFINQVLKAVFERPRPEMVDQLESFSFPSGHSMMSVGYLVVFSYFLTQYISKTSIQRILFSWGLLLIGCIGLSRIARGHHYLTDVLAGWSLAGAWVIVCIIWYERRAKAKKA